MRALRTGRLAALLAGAALTLSSCGLSLQSLPKIGGVSGPTYTVTATFANVVNLPANAQVRVGAFSVGYVSSIGVRDFQAVVKMRIKDRTRLPVGTTAEIRFDTPLGEDFVQLQPPSGSHTARLLSDGSSIPESATTTAPSVEDAFGALGALLNGGGINQLQTIVEQTNLALNGNQGKIRSLINYLSSTLTTFAQDTPSIDTALQAMATLSKTLNDGSATITQGIAALGPAAHVLAGETSDLNGLLTNLGRLSSAANSIIDASATGTVRTVQALRPLLSQLVGVQQQLGPALTAINSLETNTPRVVPGNYVQLSINANIQVPPVPADALPLHKVTVDPPDPNQSYTRSGIATLIEGGLP
ncbi:MAG TPA: MCE family protein [Acidimicrobiales bacterium]|nr:MCE family protein [Acidimicrobiales bacterium]